MYVCERRQSSGQHQFGAGLILSACVRVSAETVNQKSELKKQKLEGAEM